MKTKTIVLFEQYEGVCFVMERCLRKYQDQITVHPVYSLGQAQRLFGTQGVDLLVTEISLTNREGMEISRFARAHEPELKIVWVTVASCDAFSEEKRRLGVYKCMEKPLEIQEFRRTIAEALGVV
jgi:DNA-binding NtrC family response regulator